MRKPDTLDLVLACTVLVIILMIWACDRMAASVAAGPKWP